MKFIGLLLLGLLQIQVSVAQPTKTYGIKGQQAPALNVAQWIDGNGQIMEAPTSEELAGKVVYILAFQSWCPGCHSIGFPTMKKVIEHFEGNENIVFIAIQTPFEGHQTNTFDKLSTTQTDFELKIPFGHDNGIDGNNWPNLMRDYKTGGTPWTIIIDAKNEVVFNNFRITDKDAIRIIEALIN